MTCLCCLSLILHIHRLLDLSFDHKMLLLSTVFPTTTVYLMLLRCYVSVQLELRD